jgi:hypothetical protein
MSSSKEPGQQSESPQYVSIPCPVRRWPLFDIVPDGIAVSCRSCRHGTVHHYSRQLIEQIWAQLAGEAAKEQSG